jgi:DMSO/TMAO reductase YedYZ heme-binding membrane subunit
MKNDALAYSGVSGISLALALAILLAGLTGAAGDTPAFWYFSRASGLVAYGLLWGSVVAGLLLSGRQLRSALPPAVLLECHRTLSGLALGFAVFHGLVLVGDRSIGFSLRALLIPLSGHFEPLWVAVGQLALVLLAALLATSAWRRQLGNQTWRAFHYAAFATYWLALAHALVLGSETNNPTVALYYLVTGACVLWLTMVRIFLREPKRGG